MSWPPATGIAFPMVSERWYDQSTAGIYDPSSNVPIPANSSYVLVPFNNWSLKKVLYRSIGFDIDSAPTSDVEMIIGIYADENGQPTKKLIEVTHTQSAASPTGPVQLPLQYALEAGLHWICICFNNAALTNMRMMGWDSGAATEGFSLLGDDSPQGSTTIPKRWGWTSGPVPFPATLPETMVGTPLLPTDRVVRVCLQVT